MFIKNLKKIIEDNSLILIFIISATSTFGSLAYQISGFQPCQLCWYQRILMYPIFLLSFNSLITKTYFYKKFILSLSIPGIIIAAYQYAIQKGFINDSTTCSTLNPCSIIQVQYFGFITIPFLSLISFLLITLVCLTHLEKLKNLNRRDIVVSIIIVMFWIFILSI